MLSRQRNVRGFTLMELMVAVAVAGVLAGLAYPSFAGAAHKARRLDAVQALTQVQLAQERWRTQCPCYATSLQAPAAACPAIACSPAQGLGLATASAGRHYVLALSGVSSSGYRLSATVAPGSPQAGDTACAEMGVTVHQGQATHWPAACWSR